ncbi:LOW QUALITY PROTEIN: uncharacterized protein EMH_0011150 [Eimeria mitis]|uniref:Uncharacterized protein n=1 Tax=Eimeria mitis TaxID=44415 RepID=U6K2Y3_9EIME|nr:LOW QUALITY PROTEIN: uncharacterized protein EMH_0011150 [Eimeria mitis]CDJ32034.1 hypothetical protein, conserved [Eimeria mitis]
MGRKVPEGLGLAPGPAPRSLEALQEAQNDPSLSADEGATHDLPTLETLEEQQLYASAVHAWGETESESVRGRYGVAFKLSLILALALCASYSMGSKAWGRGRMRSSSMGSFAHVADDETNFGLGSSTGRGRSMRELEEDMHKALVEFMRRPERHESLPMEIVSGVAPGKDDAAACLARAVDALQNASASTQREVADKYLAELLRDSEDTDPELEEAQSARTALLVAVLDAFTARVKAMEHLRLIEAAAAEEEARLKKDKSRERVGLAHLLREVQGAPEEAAEATAQRVVSASTSVPWLKAKRLLNYIQLSRGKLVGDSKVAAALLRPLNDGKDAAMREILMPFESHAVSLMRKHTTLEGREWVRIKTELEEYRLVRDMMKFLEAKGQGKVFLEKASDSLCAMHRLDRACRSGASQREDFWEFLRDHWSAQVHDKLCELLEAQSQKFEKHKLGSRSYLASSAKNFLSTYAPKVKQVDVLLLQAAIALL